MKIYTKRGDDGGTGLFDGQRVRKDSPRVSAYGDVDELNAALGLARSLLEAPAARDELAPVLEGLQRDLFALGALLADPRRDAEDPAARDPSDRLALRSENLAELEGLIDRFEESLPKLRQFVLPAGCPAAAALQVARAVARRAERSLVHLADAGLGEGGRAVPLALAWLNRLSDLLFVAARVANDRSGVADEPW